MLSVRLLKTIVNDGILYEIVEKPGSIYAGKIGSADTDKGEPDIKSNVLKKSGKENCQSYELFPLIFDTMEKYHYDFGNCGEIECDFSKDVKIGYVYVSIAANN